MKNLFLCILSSILFISGCTGYNVNKSQLQHSVPTETKTDSRHSTQKQPPISISSQSSIAVFYASNKEDPDLMSPEKTYPLEIKVEGNSEREVAEKAISMLIEGPNEKEKKSGYYTTLPSETKLQSITIDEKKIVVDFNKAINDGGGSCEMMQRRSQIENTLKSLPGAGNKKIIISVDGDNEKVLQP